MLQVAGGILIAIGAIFVWCLIIARIMVYIEDAREEKRAEEQKWSEIKRTEERLKEKWEI